MKIHNTEHPEGIITVTAAAPIIGKLFVGYGNEHTKAGEAARGVAYYNADEGRPVALVTGGTSLVTVGAPVATGDEIASDDMGRAVPAVTGNTINGIAITAATAANDEIEMQLRVNPVK
ncbi:MAG: DUF2190 family protein [Desulfobacteraceae bacterium]|nr:DUF2190 family protein [Desulfobacteraceae bacterium]